MNLNQMEKELDYIHDGWGLTTNGEYLIASDGSSYIYFLDENLNEIKKINVKKDNKEVQDINELEYIDGYIWANIWKTNKINIIDEDGIVIKEIDFTNDFKNDFDLSSVDVMNGIAYNPTNKYNKKAVPDFEHNQGRLYEFPHGCTDKNQRNCYALKYE